MNSSRILYEDHKSFEHILNSLMEQNRYKKLAVSFDIDDTLIYSDTNTLIFPIYNFYTLCVKKGISVFLITALQLHGLFFIILPTPPLPDGFIERMLCICLMKHQQKF